MFGMCAVFVPTCCHPCQSDVPYGVLLSGGLDSSLVASIMSKNCHRTFELHTTAKSHTVAHSGARFGKELLHLVRKCEHGPASWPQLHSFSTGLQGSGSLNDLWPMALVGVC